MYISNYEDNPKIERFGEGICPVCMGTGKYMVFSALDYQPSLAAIPMLRTCLSCVKGYNGEQPEMPREPVEYNGGVPLTNLVTVYQWAIFEATYDEWLLAAEYFDSHHETRLARTIKNRFRQADFTSQPIAAQHSKQWRIKLRQGSVTKVQSFIEVSRHWRKRNPPQLFDDFAQPTPILPLVTTNPCPTCHGTRVEFISCPCCSSTPKGCRYCDEGIIPFRCKTCAGTGKQP